MRAWPIRPQQITGIMRMLQTKMIVQAECLDGSHRLKAPATKITAHLERMLNRIPVDVPPQLIFPRTGQFGIPMIDKIPK